MKYLVSFSNGGDMLYVAIESTQRNHVTICHEAASLILERTKDRFFQHHECGWGMKYWDPTVHEVIEGKAHFTETLFNRAKDCGGIWFYDWLKEAQAYEQRMEYES